MLKEQEQGKTNWVYTVNEETKNIEPKPINKIFKTKTTNSLVKVTLDNGESFICTNDHKLMKRDFTWERAENLHENDSMLPLYVKQPDAGNLKGYRMYYNPIENKWHYEHRQFVIESTEAAKLSSYIVHHKNFNSLDNTPTNLIKMTKSEHTTLHNRSQSKTERLKRSRSVRNWHRVNKHTKAYRRRNQKLSENISHHFKVTNQKNFKNKLLYRKKIRDIEKCFNIKWNALSNKEKTSYSVKYIYIKTDLRDKQRQISKNAYASKKDIFTAKGRTWYNNGINSIYLKSGDIVPEGYIKGRLVTDKMKNANKGKALSKERRVQMSKISKSSTWYNDGEKEYFIREHLVLPHYKKGRINHKILSVDRVDTMLDVYDLEIKDNHNFALAAGIFAHNSKDVSDGVAGSIMNAIEDPNNMIDAQLEGDLDILFT